ncbi:reverse transcriptase domain-containing protein [candidate division CSSED10-310 bacterium]|uniref:RNA-directed DNA polymerase n=1 Tax=candidate division CSSED10-310 bacterium TaxID=2855610 RepID=A0ABV6YXR8_UNCC1
MSQSDKQPTSKAELYDRIRATSKDEVILEEMIKLGFWPAEETYPRSPAAEIRRTAALERELKALRTELSRVQNEEALRRAIHKKRLADSRAKRQENKIKRENARQQQSLAWKRKKTREITYLGAQVSAGLKNQKSDRERLQQYGLPFLETASDLASAMDISISELRFLSFSRKTSVHSHYQRFNIPKKTGGQRLISAPKPRLKSAQYWILHHVLAEMPDHEAAHGFMPGRSIVSNAAPHLKSAVVINIDLKDFFPTLTYRRVKGLFLACGYSENIATILGLLCTAPDVDEVSCHEETYFVAKSERHLPQGAPTSPMITNIICRRLDRRLTGLAQSLHFQYSRYADDLTFSCQDDPEASSQSGKILNKAKSIIEHEGFLINPRKTRVLRKGRQQEVTGIVVNDKLSVNRKKLRAFRALLFQIEKDGLSGKRWGSKSDVMQAITGYAHFVAMVDPKKGAAFKQQIQHLQQKLNYQQPRPKPYPQKTPTWTQPKFGEDQEQLELQIARQIQAQKQAEQAARKQKKAQQQVRTTIPDQTQQPDGTAPKTDKTVLLRKIFSYLNVSRQTAAVNAVLELQQQFPWSRELPSLLEILIDGQPDRISILKRAARLDFSHISRQIAYLFLVLFVLGTVLVTQPFPRSMIGSILLIVLLIERYINERSLMTLNKLTIGGTGLGLGLTFFLAAYGQPLCGKPMNSINALIPVICILFYLSYLYENRYKRPFLGAGTIKLIGMITAFTGYLFVPILGVALLLSVLMVLLPELGQHRIGTRQTRDDYPVWFRQRRRFKPSSPLFYTTWFIIIWPAYQQVPLLQYLSSFCNYLLSI